MRSAVFLDRDGVINHAFVRAGKSYPPDRVEDFQLLDGVAEACAQLKAAGHLLIVVTNQPDVGTGKQTWAEVAAMHRKMNGLLPLDDVFVCTHPGADQCFCRKPRPGMLLAAAQRHGLDLAGSFLVGDRRGDIRAGQRVGCRCFFIDRHYQEPGPEPPFEPVAGLLEAARRILNPAPILPGDPR